MSLNMLKRRATSADNLKPLPDWVSSKNISFSAYECINNLKSERLKYIATHNKTKDYKKKGFYQISASEVARNIGAATTTLISTSAYSLDLKHFLDETNQILEDAKNKKLNTHAKSLSGGLKQRKKDDIRIELQGLRAELEEIKKQNALAQIKEVMTALPLPIKQKLGINI
jgi:hypothetical protein